MSSKVCYPLLLSWELCYQCSGQHAGLCPALIHIFLIPSLIWSQTWKPCSTDEGMLSPLWDHCLLTLPLGPVPGYLLYAHTQAGLFLVFSNSPDAYSALCGNGRRAFQLTFLPCIQNKINHPRWWEKNSFHWHMGQSQEIDRPKKYYV